jgi:gamma-glutamylcyclotransferase (GGCT)/AIG2-like uncharacterized protein YtfP
VTDNDIGAAREICWLAVYGTLAPGQSNHHQLAGLSGRWSSGFVRGHLHQAGWGAALGFPGLVLDDDGERLPVQLFASEDLSAHWARLDAFEGEGYRRVVATVQTPVGEVDAFVYVLAPPGLAPDAGSDSGR